MKYLMVVVVCGASVLFAACGSQGKPENVRQELAQGTELELRYSFDAAAPHFERARSAAQPGSELWLQASLGLAVAYHHEVPFSRARIEQQAVPLYQQVFSQGGHSLLAARAALHLGRLAEERDEQSEESHLPEARAWYGKVIDGWAADPVAGEATLRLSESFIQTLEPEQVRRGIALSEARAAQHPSEPWAASLWQQAGDAWWVLLHDRENAVRCLIKAEERGLPDPSKSWITIWRIATLADEAGLREVAIVHFERLIREHASSGKSWEAQQRLRALGVEPPQIQPPLELGSTRSVP